MSHSIFNTPHSTLHIPRSLLSTVHISPLHTPDSTLSTPQTPHSALHTLRCHALRFPHLHSIITPGSTLYTPHSPLHTPHSTFLFFVHAWPKTLRLLAQPSASQCACCVSVAWFIVGTRAPLPHPFFLNWWNLNQHPRKFLARVIVVAQLWSEKMFYTDTMMCQSIARCFALLSGGG